MDPDNGTLRVYELTITRDPGSCSSLGFFEFFTFHDKLTFTLNTHPAQDEHKGGESNGSREGKVTIM